MTIQQATWWRNVCAVLVVVLSIPAWVQAQTSPNNSRTPPLASVTSADGAVWTMAAGAGERVILRNGQDTAGGGTIILWANNSIYVFGGDAQWWQWTGSTWMQVGADPCASCPPPVVAPPVVVPVTNVSKLSWDMNNTTSTVVAGGSFKLYVDALAGAVLAGRTCVAAGANVTCTSPLPTLAIGQHTMAISWVDALKKESTKSNQITVAIGAILLAPTNLTAK